MKFTKILFCAMAAVASACFVSCTTSKEEINPTVKVEAVAGTDGKAVGENNDAKIEANNVPAGKTVSVVVTTAGDTKNVVASVPENANAAVVVKGLMPETSYKVMTPTGEYYVKSDAQGTIKLEKVVSGSYVIAPSTHNGGIAK